LGLKIGGGGGGGGGGERIKDQTIPKLYPSNMIIVKHERLNDSLYPSNVNIRLESLNTSLSPPLPFKLIISSSPATSFNLLTK